MSAVGDKLLSLRTERKLALNEVCRKSGIPPSRLVEIERDEEGVWEKFGVGPASIPDYLGLVGDTADGIPGLPGWGAKSTATVLAHYRTIEEIPDDAADWEVTVRSAAKLAETLAAHRDDALLYRKLAVLRRDVPLSETLADLESQCRVFAAKIELEADAKEVLADPGAQEVVKTFSGLLRQHEGDLTPEAFKAMTKATGKETGRKGKELFFPLRAAITGNVHGPDLSRVASVKGKDRILSELALQ